MQITISLVCDGCGKPLTIHFKDDYNNLYSDTVGDLVQTMFIVQGGVYCSDSCVPITDDEELDINI